MLIEEVDNIPEGMALLPLAEKEFLRLAPFERRVYIRRSKRTWLLMDDEGEVLMALGVHKPTQLSTPELWMLMAERFKLNLRRNVLALRDRIDDLFALYPHLMLRVDATAKEAQHFVRFFGFEEFYRTAAGDREFIYYEARKK